MNDPASPPDKPAGFSFKQLGLNLIDSGHQFDESELSTRFKFRFLNSVFAFACVMAFGFGVWRLITFQKPVFVLINFTFTALSIALLAGLRGGKHRIDRIGALSVVLSYLLFTATYVLIAGEAREGLYFLLVGAAFFLRGRSYGFAWLLIVIATVVGIELLPWQFAHTSAYGTTTYVIYLVALYMILRLYENQKEQDARRVQENEEKFRTLFDTSSDGILLLSGMQIVQFNQACNRLFGLDREDHASWLLSRLSPQYQPDGINSTLKLAERIQEAADKGHQSFEWLFQRGDSQHFYGEVNLTPLHVGGKGYVQAVIRDIDLRKQSELELDRYRNQLEELVRERTRRLEQSEARFSRLLEITEEGILIHDAGILVDVSDSLCRMSGYRREELIDQNFIALLIHPEYRANFRSHLDSQSAQPCEIICLRKDGSQFYVEVVSRHIEIGERRLRAASVRDISNRKEVEQALIRAKEAAEMATQAKSAFIANMSHEIRTPMNAILGLTHQLRRDCGSLWQSEQLDKISTAGQHLLSIINHILDLSKIEAGKITLAPEDFSVAQLMNRVNTLVRDMAERKGLEVELKVSENIPSPLHGDAMRLSQVLINLASNAVKFTERGKIQLLVKPLEADPDQVRLYFSVEDSGIGMTPEQTTRLFNAFEQAENTTSRKYGGTGLGLAISQHFIQLMGGQIRVHSQLGKGSSFWFEISLPRSHNGASSAQNLDPEAYAEALYDLHHGAFVLVVEDNAINQEVALDLLHEAGLEADVADNGQIAVELAARNQYDLILMDLQMPVMDGFTATEEIRRLAGYENVPILAMTANAFDEDRERCLQAGMNGHVPKPVNPEALFSALLKWLSKNNTGNDRARLAAPPKKSRQKHKSPANSVLQSIPGLDIETGMQIARGKLERYRHLLNMFVEHNGDYGRRICADLEQGDDGIAEARHLAHSLKGICGTLGMTEISTLAGRFEELCVGAAALETLQSLGKELEETLAALTTAIQKSADA